MLNFSHFFLIIIELFLPLLLGEFIAIPETYTVGSSVILRCQLQAPNGTQFVSTVPVLTTDEISNPFTFDKIQEALDVRYYGLHIPDENRTNLKGDISIFFLRESDFEIQFTCLQMFENYTLFELTLRLAAQPPTTQTTPSCEYTPQTCPPCESTQQTCPPSLNQTCEDCTIWKAIGLSLVPLIIAIVPLLLGGIFIFYFYKKYKETSTYDTRTNETRLNQLNPTQESRSGKGTMRFQSLTPPTIIDCGGQEEFN